MLKFLPLPKLQPGDQVAIVSPSFAAPGRWPKVYELGLSRLKEIFGLIPIEFPATKKLGSSTTARAEDLVTAFTDPEIKAVIASLGGDDQVTYIKNLPAAPFTTNPKPFFGYSDNSHFINHLWLHGVPSFYGGHLFTELALPGQMDDLTIKYLKHALFDRGEFELEASSEFSDIGLNWDDESLLKQRRHYQPNEGWFWDGSADGEGIGWGGCLESIDEMLRHGIPIPSLEQFGGVILAVETSEEIPSPEYVRRVLRALGERGILEQIQGLLVGRPKAWEFNHQLSDSEKVEYKAKQQAVILETVRSYNSQIPVVQNLDFGHTAPQICLPMGQKIRIETQTQKIFATF